MEWIRRRLRAASTAVRMDKEAIRQHQQRCFTDPKVALTDLAAATTVQGYRIVQQLEETFGERWQPRYCRGVAVNGATWSGLQAEANLAAVPQTIDPVAAVTVQLVNVRRFPSAEIMTAQQTSDSIDRAQETVLNPGEAVQLLHYSKSGRWAYVRSIDYYGWVQAEQLGVIREQCLWEKFIAPSGVRVAVPRWSPDRRTIFLMGARLPWADESGPANLMWNVLVPQRDGAGYARVSSVRIAPGGAFAAEELQFTERQLLLQAGRLLGQRYAWGGLGGSWDCSSLVRDVYRCFGFELPRDADGQQAIPGHKTELHALSPRAKLRRLRELPLGAMLHFDGHVMLWMGIEQGEPKVLHALHSARQPIAEQGIGGKVLITGLDLRRCDGGSFLEHVSLACWLGEGC